MTSVTLGVTVSVELGEAAGVLEVAEPVGSEAALIGVGSDLAELCQTPHAWEKLPVNVNDALGGHGVLAGHEHLSHG